MSNAKMEMDHRGSFRIMVDGEVSSPTHYAGIAVLNHSNGKTYIGVSAYYDGTLKGENVYEVTPLQTELLPECNSLWDKKELFVDGFAAERRAALKEVGLPVDNELSIIVPRS